MYRVPFIICVSLALFGCGSGSESFDGKHECSLLDAAVATKLVITSSQIVANNDRNYLVIPKANQNIWIMLKPRYEPYYKQLPSGDYSISKEMFRQVLSSGLASPTVLACLESHIAE